MIALREVPDAEGSAAEIQYIRAAQESLGMKLVNATVGGEGCFNPTPETRLKMSAAQTGVPKSPAHCANISAAQKGRTFSSETRSKLSAAQTGKKASTETRSKLSAAQKGKTRAPMTKEHCANIRAVKTGVPWSPARRAAHEAKKNAKL